MSNERTKLLVILFFRFLKEKELYNTFLNNCKKEHPKKIYEVFECFEPNYWIVYGFKWSDTLQGRVFWSNISKEWQRVSTKASSWLMNYLHWPERLPAEIFLKKQDFGDVGKFPF